MNDFIQEEVVDYSFTPPDRRFDDSPFFLPDFNGKEDPALYENETYIEWLRVTGECQQPLAGETFWKPMKETIVF